MMDDDEFEAVGGMIGSENRSTRRKPAAVLSRPPQIPSDKIWVRTLAPSVGSRRLTTYDAE
jgi:hypothetical protein